MNGSEQAGASAEYTALVRGMSPAFPRGGVWMFCFWFAGLYAVMFLFLKFPSWYWLVVLVAFAAAAAVLTIVFSRATSRAFGADRGGIRLGHNTAAGRTTRLGWEQIRELRISSYPHGSVLQILLNSDAAAAERPRQAASLMLMVLPFGIRRTRPELQTVLPGPPRYRVPLAKVSPDELRSALSALAPATVVIEIAP